MAMVEVDRRFPLLWPFGLLKTLLWVMAMALLISLYCPQRHFGGVGFVFGSGWALFWTSLIFWLCHLFGLQRKTFQMGSAFAYVPFALLIFFYSLLFFILLAISTLICIICLIRAFSYPGWTLILCYFFASVFSGCASLINGYLAVLLYRSAPNGRVMNLRTVIIEGTGTANFQPVDSHQPGTV